MFVVRVDPEQTYYPKITSRINSLGKMESNPINIMTPEFIENIENFSDFHK